LVEAIVANILWNSSKTIILPNGFDYKYIRLKIHTKENGY